MAFQFPWTNLHELNLDWFLSKFKQFTNNFLGTTATAESVPYGTQPSVTVTGGDLDDDTDIVDPFTFNFKIPAGAQGEQGVQGVPGQDGFSPIATVTKSGTVATITITDANGTTTTTISDGEVTQAQLDTKAPVIVESVNGSIASFSDGADNMPVNNLTIGINPVQSGSGDPSPDNIRPISGWTGANVTRTGKNLLEKSFDYYTNVSTDLTNYFLIKAGTYNFNFASSTATAWRFLVRIKDLDGNVLSDSTHNPSTNFSYRSNLSGYGNGVNTTATDIKLTFVENCYIRILYWQTSSSDTFTNCQLELGSTATTYEPYQSTSLTVDWTTEAGTVYGGTIDFATGLLTVTHQIFQVPATATWTINNNAGYTSLSSLGLTPSNMKNPPAGTANRSVIRTSWCKTNALKASANGWSATASSSEPQFVVSYDDYLMLNIGVANPTAAQINQFIADVGLQLYYPLATPQTYQLTGQQLKTLYGTNNLLSNVGNVSVTYPADTKLFIEKLTMPTEDDMVANQAITSGKYFMIGNSLYLALANIASGSQIIPGTNATPLSLADALNLL